MLVDITRARRPQTALIVGAALFALGSALTGLAYAILTAGNVRATRDLGTAADWLVFVAVSSGLAAVAMTAWTTLVVRSWQLAVELLAAVGASLLIVIGSLIVAANSPDGSAGGSIVTAVGVGGWMVVTLVAAARRAIAEQGGSVGRTSDLWLIASGSLLILAVATGLPSPGSKGRALPIAESVLFMLGFAGLAVTFELAARRRHIISARIRILNTGLVAMAVAYLAAAIAAGFVFAPSAGLTTVRVGLSIPAFLTAIAWVIITLAAFWRLADLIGPAAAYPGGITADPGGFAERPPYETPQPYSPYPPGQHEGYPSTPGSAPAGPVGVATSPGGPASPGGAPSPIGGFPAPPPPPPPVPSPAAPSRWSLRRTRPAGQAATPTIAETQPSPVSSSDVAGVAAGEGTSLAAGEPTSGGEETDGAPGPDARPGEAAVESEVSGVGGEAGAQGGAVVGGEAATPAPTEMLHCGVPLPPGATSCPRCGQAV